MVHLISLLFLTLFISCESSNNYDDYYYNSWYTAFGTQCGYLGAGCDYYSNGLKIHAWQDPFYGGPYSNGENPAWYNNGWGWQSPSGIIYDAYGNALNGATTSQINHDLITLVANDEAIREEKAAFYLSQRFSLESPVAIKIAKILNDWKKLGAKGRTASDLADFTKRLYGIEMSKIEGDLKNAMLGDKTGLEESVNLISQSFHTSPEKMRDLLNEFHGKQLEVIGVEL